MTNLPTHPKDLTDKQMERAKKKSRYYTHTDHFRKDELYMKTVTIVYGVIDYEWSDIQKKWLVTSYSISTGMIE